MCLLDLGNFSGNFLKIFIFRISYKSESKIISKKLICRKQPQLINYTINDSETNNLDGLVLILTKNYIKKWIY